MRVGAAGPRVAAVHAVQAAAGASGGGVGVGKREEGTGNKGQRRGNDMMESALCLREAVQAVRCFQNARSLS